MNLTLERSEFAPPAPAGLLRALLLALLAHAALVALLTWGVQWKRDAETASFSAELWSELAVEAPAKPAPSEVPPAEQPTPVETRAAPNSAEVDIALAQQKRQARQAIELAEQEALRQEKRKQEKLKQEQLKQEKLKQAQAEKLKQQALEKKRAELERQQLETQRQKNLLRMNALAGANGSANASALRSAGPSASYAGRLRARIKPNIVFTQELAGNPAAEVEVHSAPNGSVIGRKLTRSSGVKAWDEAVLKAIDKTEVLPRDSDGSVPAALLLVFRPKD